MPAVVPSNPGWYSGYTPTSAEWAQEWSSKVDFPAPISQGGTSSQTAAGANYNFQQRAIIDAGFVTPLQLITEYGVKTASGHATLLLPPIAQAKPGDWIALVDVDDAAATYVITIQANGSEQIELYSGSSNTQQIAVDSGAAVLICTGSAWRMISVTATAPAAGSIADGATWTIYDNGVPKSVTAAQFAAFSSGVIQFIQWAIWFNTTPEADELLALYTAASAFTIGVNFAGSRAAAPLVNPTPSFVLTVSGILSGTPTTIGTITVSTGGAVTFATAGGGSFAVAVGDQLKVTGPGSADATIAGFAATIKGTLI